MHADNASIGVQGHATTVLQQGCDECATGSRGIRYQIPDTQNSHAPKKTLHILLCSDTHEDLTPFPPSPTRFGACLDQRQGSGRKPGDFGFDPLGFGKGKDISRLELAELKNGRLAMLAFSGIIHHYFITGKGPVELMTGA